MGRVLLASRAPCETERWLARAALEPRTERTIVSPDALRTELVAVGERRWSLVEEELEVGLRSLAVPVRAREGQVLAALNVPTFSDAHSHQELLDRYLPALWPAARHLESALQTPRPQPQTPK